MKKRRINSRQQEFKQAYETSSIINDIAQSRQDTLERLGKPGYELKESGTVLPDDSNWFGKATNWLGETLFGEDNGTTFVDRAKAVWDNPSGAWHSFHQ